MVPVSICDIASFSESNIISYITIISIESNFYLKSHNINYQTLKTTSTTNIYPQKTDKFEFYFYFY
jgi:hypothetical protein